MLVTPNGNVLRNILSATVVKKPTGLLRSGMVLAGALPTIASQTHNAKKQPRLLK